MEWSVDGGPPQRASSWDKYALHFPRAHYILLCDSLEDTEHTCSLTIIPEHQPGSKGTWIRMGAFLIGKTHNMDALPK